MEQLKYTVADSTIAYLLGMNNFISDESAILELVKNAYDANSSSLTIQIEDDSIGIFDDGVGMNRDDIINKWMSVGSSDKGYDVEDVNGGRRVLAGEKGIGRFALARLGKRVVLESRREGFEGIRWTTDWNTSFLDSLDCNYTGTHILITHLNSSWDKKAVGSLISYLQTALIDERMHLKVVYEKEDMRYKNIFINPRVGINCLSEILLDYDSSAQEIKVSVHSDEFLPIASEFTKQNINEKETVLNALDECQKVVKKDISEEQLKHMLKELGDFSARFLFRFRPNSVDMDRFLYKHSDLPESLPMNGIVLYRNAFSITTYDGKRDWLGLGKRSRKSPAAATHPTGNWRVRENQITGYVLIDKKKNKALSELSNRQGLEEDDYYTLFVSIINACFAEFERYRQCIIRDVNKKNDVPPKEHGTAIADLIINYPQTVFTLTDEDAKKLAGEIRDLQEESKRIKVESEESEQRLQYDVRILNVLATIGLKASSIAHEFKNDRGKISANIQFIIKALKEYGLWEKLQSSECTEHEYKNVPHLLDSFNDSSRKILTFVDTMLSDIEKKRFQVSEINISEEIKSIMYEWEYDYRWIRINYSGPENCFVKISEDLIQVILDNLILNSVQQNDSKNQLQISISVQKLEDESFLLKYSDDGVGLDNKYKDNPKRILEVHETTRKNGHGLGMWIVNNTVVMSGGEVIEIGKAPGFSISMTINGK